MKNYINKKNATKIIELIGEKRFQHSLGVMKTAKHYCEKLGADVEKGQIAGLFHDCGKFMDKKLAFDFIKEHGLEYKLEYLENYQLLHPHLGADVAKIVFNVTDEEILNAIRFHTTLRENPTLLEKIIFITDAIEPGRDFEGVDKLRSLTEENIDKGILYSLEDTILAIINKKKYLGIETVLARNYFLKLNKDL